MKKIDITYSDSYPETPMTFWVHHKIDRYREFDINNFAPPLSSIIGGKGYPLLYIQYLDTDLVFSSVAEIEHAIDILGAKNLPTTTSLSLKRNASVGPNGHWLSRLPARLKPWKKREKLLPYLFRAKELFLSIYSNES